MLLPIKSRPPSVSPVPTLPRQAVRGALLGEVGGRARQVPEGNAAYLRAYVLRPGRLYVTIVFV